MATDQHSPANLGLHGNRKEATVMTQATAPQSALLSKQEIHSIETLYRAFTDKNPICLTRPVRLTGRTFLCCLDRDLDRMA